MSSRECLKKIAIFVHHDLGSRKGLGHSKIIDIGTASVG